MSSKPGKPRVIFSVTNCICHDQRVLKIAGTVSGLGTEVTILGRKRGDCCNNDSVPFKTRRFRMLFQKGFLFYMFYNIRLFIYLIFHRCEILVSNDLDTLLPNYLVSKLRRVPLVYDSHEYFTGVPELQDRAFVRSVWKGIEKMIFPHLVNVMTVSDSIAEQYEAEYKIRPVTVRNCSVKADNIVPYSKEELGIKPENMLLILQGTGINKDRGGEELIDALAITENISLLVAGSGDLFNALKLKIVDLGLSHRVKFFQRMPWNELMRYTRSADAGVCLDKDTNINYRFSLPNKLFDYISAGIPIIASKLPETGRILNEFGCGLVIDEVTPEKIADALSLLKNNPQLLEALRENSVKASAILNWESESKKVEELYKNILGLRTSPNLSLNPL